MRTLSSAASLVTTTSRTSAGSPSVAGSAERVPESAARETTARQEREQRAVLHADDRDAHRVVAQADAGEVGRGSEPRAVARQIAARAQHRPARRSRRDRARRRARAAGAGSRRGCATVRSPRRRAARARRSRPRPARSSGASFAHGRVERGKRVEQRTRPTTRSNRRARRTRRATTRRSPTAASGEPRRRSRAAATSAAATFTTMCVAVTGSVGRAEASAGGSRRPHEQPPRGERQRAVDDARPRPRRHRRPRGRAGRRRPRPHRGCGPRRARRAGPSAVAAGPRGERAAGSSRRRRTRAPRTRRRTDPPSRRRSRRCSRGRCSVGFGTERGSETRRGCRTSLRPGLRQLGDLRVD